MGEEKEERRAAHEDAPGAIVQDAGPVDRAPAIHLPREERRAVEPLVAVRHDDPRVVPEPAAAREDGRAEGGVLAEVRLDEAHGADGLAPVGDAERRDETLDRRAAPDPLRVVQAVR